MISELRFDNYKCFKDHNLPFRDMTIIVGENNVGKSTVVEALRLVSIICNRYTNLSFVDPPYWAKLPSNVKGVIPSLRGLDINFESVIHRYGKPPAIITVVFQSGCILKIYVSTEGQIYGVIRDEDGEIVDSKSRALYASLPRVGILPQIGPLAQREEYLTPAYVRSVSFTPLSSAHFRNELNFYYKSDSSFFSEFKKMTESSWRGLQIFPPDKKMTLGEEMKLLVRDGDFVADIGWMGHGLQMWLQIMWFLTLSMANEDDIVILDEPDVYMHADLQRKLIRLLKGRFSQTIITTHSIEIMAEVDASDILIVDRQRKQSDFADSLPNVQKLIDHIGSIHNIQLTRLWSSRRFIIVEGDDMILLKKFHDKIFPKSQIPIDQIPNMPIGGWDGWNYAVGSWMFLKNAGNERITTYCLFDSDYHLPKEIRKRIRDASVRGIEAYIWKHKELENFLIVPKAIQRVIQAKFNSKRGSPPTVEAVDQKVNEIAENLKTDVIDDYAEEFIKGHKEYHTQNANRWARKYVEGAWRNKKKKFSIIPGKEVISSLSSWSQKEFGISLSANSIVKEMMIDEINDEIKFVLGVIETASNFR